MEGETSTAREGLVSSYKNVCGECAGCMLSFFLLKACHIFEGKKRKNNIVVDFVDLFLFCNFV